VSPRLVPWLALLAAVAPMAASGSARADAPRAPAFLGLYGEDASGTTARARSVAAAQRAAGAGTIRVPFVWSRIEVLPGVLDLREEDTLVAAAATAGLDVLPFLVDAPVFRAAPTPPGHKRRPAVPGDLGVFAAALVAHYGPGGTFWSQHPEVPARPIRAWQVWNEPNLPVWWYPRPDPAQYTELLRATSVALRAADPGAEVIAAGLPDSDGGMPFEQYVGGMYAAGAPRWFDAFALHAYAPSAQGTIDLVRYVRGLLDALGDTGRPLDVTEFGWPSGGPVKQLTTTEEGQAQRVGDVLRTLGAERGRLGLERLIYFSWRDRTVAPGMQDAWPYHTGLLRTDAGAKPALAAFRGAADALASPGAEGPVLAEPPATSASAPPSHRRVDHRPRIRLLTPRRQALARALRFGWRVRVSCVAQCALRMRLIVSGKATAGHVRLLLGQAGARTVRLTIRPSLGHTLRGRRTAAFALEVADVARVPLRVVTRIRLGAVR
jgi:hypothetical protein